MFVGNAVVMALGAASSVALARALDPVPRGELAAAFALAGVVSQVCALGLDQAIVFGAARPREFPGVARAGMIAALIQGTAASVAVYVLAPVVLASAGAVSLARLMCPWPLMTAVMGVAQSYWQGTADWKNLVRNRALLAALYAVVAAIILWTLDASRQLFIIAYLVGTALILATTLEALRREIAARCEWSTVRAMLSYGIRAAPASLLWLTSSRLDQVVFGALGDSDSLGVYIVAVAAAAPITPLASALGAVAFSTIAAEGADRSSLARRTVRRSFFALVVGSAVVVVTAPWAMPIIFGGQYRRAVAPAIVLAIGSVPLGFGVVLSDVLRGYGRPGLSSVGQGVSAILTIVLITLLIPKFGPVGAATASALSYAAGAATLFVFYRRTDVASQ